MLPLQQQMQEYQEVIDFVPEFLDTNQELAKMYPEEAHRIKKEAVQARVQLNECRGFEEQIMPKFDVIKSFDVSHGDAVKAMLELNEGMRQYQKQVSMFTKGLSAIASGFKKIGVSLPLPRAVKNYRDSKAMQLKTKELVGDLSLCIDKKDAVAGILRHTENLLSTMQEEYNPAKISFGSADGKAKMRGMVTAALEDIKKSSATIELHAEIDNKLKK